MTGHLGHRDVDQYQPVQDWQQVMCNIFTWLYGVLCSVYVMTYCIPTLHYSALCYIEYRPRGR
eukprot:3851442-Ditylum_brightwellii.AAC.1